MEQLNLAKKDAVKHMKVADHLLTMTYPLVNDPKLLKLVMKNLYMSVKKTMAAFILYNKPHTKIKDDFNKLLKKTTPLLDKYEISKEYLVFLNDLNKTINTQKKSEVEFIRKNKFVFTNKDYKLNTITQEEMKEYLIKGKLFMRTIMEVIK